MKIDKKISIFCGILLFVLSLSLFLINVDYKFLVAIFLFFCALFIVHQFRKRSVVSINKKQVLLIMGVSSLIYVMTLYLVGINYGFNKSHSVAYGLLSYQMTYLKANYFNLFMSNIMNNVIGSTNTMISYIKYAKVRGVLTYKPNINVSTTCFELTKVGLFMPIQSIHSIGVSISKDIVEERKKNGLFRLGEKT